MRPSNYVQEAYSDGTVKFTVSLESEAHRKVLERLKIDNLNRTQWIRKAVKEKLERDTSKK